MIDAFNTHLATFAGIIGSLTVIFGVPLFRRIALAPFRFLRRVSQLPDLILAEVKQLRTIVDKVNKQVNPNSGSSIPDSQKRIEDAVKRTERGVIRLDAHHKHSFISQPRPAMEMDGDANALLLSAAMTRLFHADPEADLKGLSYLQFIDPERVDDFREAFLRVVNASHPSAFRFAVHVFNTSREPRGTWEWRALPVGPRFGGDVLYTACLHPVDDLAREIATRNHWLV